MTALLLQAEAPGLPAIASLGVGGAIAALVLWFYRQDRQASEKRIESLASDFKQVIQENTEASTALKDAIKTVAQCPFNGHGKAGG